MKKTLLILSLLVSLISFAQDSKDTVKSKPIVPPADSVVFISAIDLVEFNKYLKKTTSYEDYPKLTPEQVVNKLYNWAVIEWNRKKKKNK